MGATGESYYLNEYARTNCSVTNASLKVLGADVLLTMDAWQMVTD